MQAGQPRRSRQAMASLTSLHQRSQVRTTLSVWLHAHGKMAPLQSALHGYDQAGSVPVP
jgi:hypothetical protein